MDIATTLADPTNGISQEIADIGAFVFESTAASKALPEARSRTMTFSVGPVLHMRDRFDQGKFVWNPSAGAYEVTETSLAVSAGDVSGTLTSINFSVSFFTSGDASGTGVQLIDPSSDLASNAGTVRSMKYHREISGTVTDSRTGVTRAFGPPAATDLTVRWGAGTSLSVDGTHTRTFTHSFPDGRTASGTISLTVPPDLAVSWEQRPDFSYMVIEDGTITGIYDATVSRADGTTQDMEKTAGMEFDRSETATVSVVGLSVRVNLLTGRI
ncbi:MAG: hypothetical protein IMZ69_04840 [Spirochaetes bacterium]|nr:hypothetical protein [Spirochaetota bacterium]